MGKICVVKSCPSGRKLKKRKNDSPQSLSYFQPTVCKIIFDDIFTSLTMIYFYIFFSQSTHLHFWFL